MPWCESCSRFHDAEALSDKGECPTCGTVLVAPKKVPWHFRLIGVATVIYLTYRLVQGILWVVHHV